VLNTPCLEAGGQTAMPRLVKRVSDRAIANQRLPLFHKTKVQYSQRGSFRILPCKGARDARLHASPKIRHEIKRSGGKPPQDEL